MDLNEFINKFANAIEVKNVTQLNSNTEFRELEEWSSLSVMLLIAFYDEEYEIEIGDKEIKECITLLDLFNLTKK